MEQRPGTSGVAVPLPSQPAENVDKVPSGMHPPLIPATDASTSIPPQMVPPLQFMHVPVRPSSTRHQRHTHSAQGSCNKVTVPIFSLKRLPPASMHEPQQGNGGVDAQPGSSRPPTAPSNVTVSPREQQHQYPQVNKSSRNGSAATLSRALFRNAPGSAGTQSDQVSWLDESPRVASASKHVAPPLVVLISKHLTNEMNILSESKGDVPSLDPMEALQPHREALRMLIDGLPSYGSLLANIMVAYDAALKNQACVTYMAREISSNAMQVKQSHDDEVATLHQQLDALEQRSKDASKAFQLKLAESKSSTSISIIESLTKENQALQQKLDAFEAEKSSDLEKMMTLIAAVKECDSRVKTLEDSLQQARLQVDDMNSLKKMMAESQDELGTLKTMYKDSVPLSRFLSATKELEAKLLESQKETKRVRRLCITRGSVIDTLEKKLKNANEELDRFRMAVGAKSIREAMTPRPDWLSAQKAVPELKDFAADAVVEMLDDDTHVGRNVGGTKESSLQVQFLVDKIVELQAALETTRNSGGFIPGISSVVSLGSVESQASSHSVKHRQSVMANASTAAPQSPRLPGGSGMSLIIAQGLGNNTLPHMRELGVIPKVVLEAPRLREFVYDFFNGCAQKQADVLTAAPEDLSRRFLSFSALQFATFADMRQKFSALPVYLAYNLIDMAATTSLPQLILFQHVLDGRMPIRIAMDALEVEKEVRRELEALCDSHNKTRLRRATVLELIVPLLAFKSREEVEELRNALGVESTVDVALLISPKSKFMEALFEQECHEGIKLYCSFLEKLTAASTVGLDGIRMITTSGVLNAVCEVEPRTEQKVIDALVVGSADDDATFPLAHTINALKTAELVRVSPTKSGGE